MLNNKSLLIRPLAAHEGCNETSKTEVGISLPELGLVITGPLVDRVPRQESDKKLVDDNSTCPGLPALLDCQVSRRQAYVREGFDENGVSLYTENQVRIIALQLLHILDALGKQGLATSNQFINLAISHQGYVFLDQVNYVTADAKTRAADIWSVVYLLCMLTVDPERASVSTFFHLLKQALDDSNTAKKLKTQLDALLSQEPQHPFNLRAIIAACETYQNPAETGKDPFVELSTLLPKSEFGKQLKAFLQLLVNATHESIDRKLDVASILDSCKEFFAPITTDNPFEQNHLFLPGNLADTCNDLERQKVENDPSGQGKLVKANDAQFHEWQTSQKE